MVQVNQYLLISKSKYGVFMENQDLEVLAIQERRNYQNQWRKKNRERVRVYNHNQWIKRAKATLAASEQSNINGENNDERKDT